MKFFTLRIWFLALYLAVFVACAQATTLTFVTEDGEKYPITGGVLKVPTTRGNVEAEGVPSNTQSVRCEINGRLERYENAPPYFFKGDQGGKPNIADWKEKAYTLSAACYPRDGGKGAAISGGGVSVQFSLTLSVDPPDPDPNPDPPPVPPVGGARMPRGYSIYPQGDRQWAPGPSLSAELLANPAIEWILYRDRWKYLEPSDNQFDLSLMKRELQRYKAAGKKIGVLVMTGGGCSPAWLEGPRHQGVLVPWAPSIGPQFRELTAQISRLEVTPGVPLANDPSMVMYYPNGPTVPSHEMHLQGMDQAPGFSAEGMFQAWAYAINTQHMYFPKVAGGLAISVNGPVKPYLDRSLNHLRAVKGSLATVQHNALSNKAGIRTRGYEAHAKLFDLHAQGWFVMAEMLDSAVNASARMETNDVMVAIRNLPVGRAFVVYPPDWKQLKVKMP
jgi:hypothetical protein